jgi:hypothetical protein
MSGSSWRSGKPYSEDEDAIIRGMFALGKTRNEIAKTLNRSDSSLGSRMTKLGLSSAKRPVYTHRRDLGPLRTCEMTAPLTLGAGDDRYVKACLAQGGFIYRTTLPNGQRVEVRP